MKKIILGLFIGFLFFGSTSLAIINTNRINADNIFAPKDTNGQEEYSENGIVFLRSAFMANTNRIESFLDTKTGVVCYVVNRAYSVEHGVGWETSAISCVKN